jgi:hypothetical protein
MVRSDLLQTPEEMTNERFQNPFQSETLPVGGGR